MGQGCREIAYPVRKGGNSSSRGVALPTDETVRRLVTILVVLVAALLAPATVSASELIDRDATGVKLAVNRAGQALLTYRANGKARRVLAWGAVNAIAPTTARPSA